MCDIVEIIVLWIKSNVFSELEICLDIGGFIDSCHGIVDLRYALSIVVVFLV